MRSWLIVALVLAGVALPSGALAQDPAEPAPAAPPISTETTRGLALGTGVRASAVSAAAVAYNPASMPIAPLYHIDGSVGYEGARDRWTATGVVVDSTRPMSAGLMASGIFGEFESGMDIRLAVAMPLSEAIAVGVAGRYISLEPQAQDQPVLVRGITLDASLRVSPTEGLHLAAFGYNLLDLESAWAPRVAGGSASLTVGEALTIGGDCLVDFTTYGRASWTAGGGAEYLSGARIPMRLGYRYDDGTGQHDLTFGAGYVDDKVSLDFSLRQGVVGGDATAVMASVRYFVQ
jgi:hypothetical protein